MAQIIEDKGSIAGRIGRGFGKGLADQVPREIERNRLSSGLKNFSKNAKNLSPLEQLSEISSVPGVTPQMIQSFGELAKQQAQGDALKSGINSRPDTNRFPSPQQVKSSSPDSGKSITTTDPIRHTIENYIPKSYDQILERAGELYNANTALYKQDPNNAIQAAVQEDSQNQAINTAQQNKRKTQQDVQTRVQTELEKQAKNANVQIPDNVYSDIEDRAIQSVNSGEMTELEAGKHYKKELDKISRDYKALETIGDYSILSRKPSENKAALQSIRKGFKERNDLENLADSYISRNGLSPSKAYYLAYPVSDVKDLNNAISKLPELQSEASFRKGFPERDIDPELQTKKTLDIAKKIAPLLGKEGSLLSVAEELKSRGYDPNIWMDYVDKNRKNLGLTERQARELDKPRSFFPSMNDMWMFYFSGLDKLVEQ